MNSRPPRCPPKRVENVVISLVVCFIEFPLNTSEAPSRRSGGGRANDRAYVEAYDEGKVLARLCQISQSLSRALTSTLAGLLVQD